MDQILTEQDVKALETVATIMVPITKCDIMRGIASRARALLVQRDALKAERDEAIKERDDAMLRAQKAVMDEMRNNGELTECRHALGGFAGPTDGISEEVKKVVAELEGCRKNMRDVKVLLLPESEGSNVPHTVIVERVKKLLAEAAERDTLAARVKELEGRVKDIVHCVPGTCPLNVEATSALHTAHEDGIRAGVSFVRRVLMDVGPVGTMTRVDKELDKLLRGATPMTHDAYATFDGNGRLDCLFHKDGPMPPEAEFVIVVRKNQPSLSLPDPDPRDAEIRALKDELARVTAERDGERSGTYLDSIRSVSGVGLVFGDYLVDAIKAMKEELEQAKKDAAFGRAALKHAEALGIDTNKELGQQYRALRRDAEAWRRMFHPVHPDEASKIVIRYHFLDKDTKEVVVKDNAAPEYASQPPEGHMIHIPAEYCGDSSRKHAYADGYLAGKGAK